MKSETVVFSEQESCSILYNDLKDDKVWGLEMCLKGSTTIGFLQNGKYNALKAHIGNINQIIKTSKLFSEMEFLKDLRSIINYALVLTSKTTTVEALKAFKAFEV